MGKRLKNPKSKGDDYEREVAAFLDSHIPPWQKNGKIQRALLSGGGRFEGSWDLENTRFNCIYMTGQESMAEIDIEMGFECKRTERISIWAAFEQANKHKATMEKNGFKTDNVIPVVCTRRNRMDVADSLVFMTLKDLVTILSGHCVKQEYSLPVPADQDHSELPELL